LPWWRGSLFSVTLRAKPVVALLLVGSPKPDRSGDVFCDGTSKYAKWTTRESGFDSQGGHRFFTVPSTLYQVHWGFFHRDREWGLKLAGNLQVLPRMCGPIHPLSYTSTRHDA
jgi:hypothetical protein